MAYTSGNISLKASWNSTNTSNPGSNGSAMKSVTVVGIWTARDSLEICFARMDGSVRKVRAGWRVVFSLSGVIFGASGQISASSCLYAGIGVNEGLGVKGSCWGRAAAVAVAVRARRRCILLFELSVVGAPRVFIYMSESGNSRCGAADLYPETWKLETQTEAYIKGIYHS